jgi:cobalt/nickel transport system permease protein
MHTPDGFLDAKTALVSSAAAVAGLGLALRQVRRTLPPRRVPLLGLAAAFVFAAQMLNFPVAGGTSGHLVGAALAAVLLGPGAAVLALSAVVLLQALLFSDGGLTALGANLFNMAVVAPFAGYAAFAAVRRLAGPGLRAALFGAAFGAWCSIVAAAFACAGELAWAGAADPRVAFPAVTGIHMIIGAGEAAITALVVAAVARVRPELVLAPDNGPAAERRRGLALHGLLVTIGLMVLVAPFACPWPDGLEKVAERLGFAHRMAASPVLPGPLADYVVPGITSPVLAIVLAGAAGTLAAFGLAWLLARALTPRRPGGAGRGFGPSGEWHDIRSPAADAPMSDQAAGRTAGNPARGQPTSFLSRVNAAMRSRTRLCAVRSAPTDHDRSQAGVAELSGKTPAPRRPGGAGGKDPLADPRAS